jgi:hypothetical protein
MPYENAKLAENKHPRVVDCTDDGYTLQVKVINLPNGRTPEFLKMVCNQIKVRWEQSLRHKVKRAA